METKSLIPIKRITLKKGDILKDENDKLYKFCFFIGGRFLALMDVRTGEFIFSNKPYYLP